MVEERLSIKKYHILSVNNLCKLVFFFSGRNRLCKLLVLQAASEIRFPGGDLKMKDSYIGFETISSTFATNSNNDQLFNDKIVVF